MRQDIDFFVRYQVEDPVPIRDIIESLQGIEMVLREATAFLPRIVPGVEVEHTEIKVRQIVQESPLRELFVLSLFLAFQKDLEAEVPPLLEQAIGQQIPHSMDTIVTLLALIIVFYGVGAIKDLVIGRVDGGPSQRKLDSLIGEIAQLTGTSDKIIREKLDERYGEKTAWRRLTNATARFFRPSKLQDSAAVNVNDRLIDQETMRDIPAHYIFEDAKEEEPARDFNDVILELHAQDKDHRGQGWAAIVRGLTEKRVRLKLMPGVDAAELWGVDNVKGDVTVVYSRIGSDLLPKEVHLHRVR